MTPSLGFNKPESANFIFECMQYLMPEEGRGKKTLPDFFFYACAEPFCRGRCHSTSANEGLWQRRSPAMFRHLYSFFNLKETKVEKKKSTPNET